MLFPRRGGPKAGALGPGAARDASVAGGRALALLPQGLDAAELLRELGRSAPGAAHEKAGEENLTGGKRCATKIVWEFSVRFFSELCLLGSI